MECLVTDTRTVKRGDRYPVLLTASMALTGATVRLLARGEYDSTGIELGCTFDGAEVTHVLDGTLDVGTWLLEVEATWPGSPPTIATFPTNQHGESQYVVLVVEPDLG